VGFGFDGDGDRMMAVNSDGNMVNPDQLLAAYAGYVIESQGGGVVVTHVGASMNVDDMVGQAGGKVMRTPVGDAFITEAMAKHNAVFGGEPVGAWVHPDIHMCPDGVLSALKLLRALEEKDMNLNEFIGQAENYPIGRSKLECPNKIKLQTMKLIDKNYSNVFRAVENVSRVDGIRLTLDNGWVLIRASGTEPIIRVTVEGRTVTEVESLMNLGEKLVKDTLGKMK
jgi:phosphoglucosamine mutase